MSHDPYWHERDPSMCAGCEREHYQQRRDEHAYEQAHREHLAALEKEEADVTLVERLRYKAESGQKYPPTKDAPPDEWEFEDGYVDVHRDVIREAADRIEELEQVMRDIEALTHRDYNAAYDIANDVRVEALAALDKEEQR